MKVRKNLVTGLFICLLILCAAIFFKATPALASGETCVNGQSSIPNGCAEDLQLNGCTQCHSGLLTGGNRNGTDRQIFASPGTTRHQLFPKLADWTNHVESMIIKSSTAILELTAGFLNTNHCTGCTGPILGSPVQSNVTSTGAIVTWGTSYNGFEDEPTDTVLYYGTTAATQVVTDLSCVASGTCQLIEYRDHNNTANKTNNAPDTAGLVFTAPGCVTSSTCAQISDSTLVAHHVVTLTGLTASTKYYMVNQATSTHGTTRSTYAVSFRTRPPSTGGGIPARVYVSEDESGSTPIDRIVIIDPATNTQVLPSISITGTDPAELAAHPDGSAVYATVGGNISVIDTSTNIEFTSLLGVGDLFNHVVVSPNGTRLYLAFRTGAGTIHIKVYDVTSSLSPSFITTISNPIFDGCYAPLGLAISPDPDGSQLYLACRTTAIGPDRFYMVDTASGTPTQTATFTRDSTNYYFINAFAVTPDGTKVYVARADANTGSKVEIFDGGTGANVGSIPLPPNSLPRAGVVSPDGTRLYVADQVVGVHVIDTGSDSYLLTMAQGSSRGFDIAMSTDGTRVYTTLLGNVFVNDTTSNSPVTTVTGDFSSARNVVFGPGQAGTPSPDVVMTNVTPNAASVPAGDTLSVTDTVKNQGTASTDSSFYIAYSLSPNSVYGDGDDVTIVTTRVVGPLGMAATDTGTTNLLIPGSTSPGNYHVCAFADSTGALAEGNVDNNTLCSTGTVQVTRPDLVMTAVTPNSSSFVPGGTLSVTDTVQNIGGATTGVGFIIAYDLSPDPPTLPCQLAGHDGVPPSDPSQPCYNDTNAVPISTTRSVGALAPGASNTATTSLLIPGSTPPGNYRVCAFADPNNVVSENDTANNGEYNNKLCSSVTVGPSVPDLVMTVVSTTATAAAPGASFTLSNSAKNQGAASAGSFTIAFHLSVDQTYGGGDDIAFTTTRTVSSLAAGSTSTASTSLAVPSGTALGNYYVCATADSANSVLEGDETNNARCTTTTIQVTRPDLIMTAVTPNAATVSATATLSVTDSAKNQGTVSAGSFKVGYRLSLNTTYGDGDDVAITTTRTIASLAGGVTSTATTTLSIPNTTSPGNYYVCAKADSANAITELDETNNTLCSPGTVTVPPADLIMTVVSTTATVLAPGGNLTLSNTAKNQGSFPAGAFTIAFHLSTNTTYGDGDDVAFTATRSVSSLASGASSAAVTSLTIPAATPLGTYYVCALADSGSTVTESDETNNSLCTSTTIQVSRPDLIMTAVTPNASTVNQGATLSTTDTTKNQGPLSAGVFRVGYHLSVNTTYGDGDDVVIGTTRSVTSLAAGASNTATTSLTIPSTTPPGNYYVCALTDSLSQVTEIDETNNTLCSAATVLVPPPDLIISAISTTATTVAKGANFSLSNTAKNQGGSKAGTFVIAFHLSTNTTYGDGDDVTITQTRSITSLAIGATSAGSTTLTVPLSTPSGTYYACALADSNNTVAEGDETNNSGCTGTTIIVP